MSPVQFVINVKSIRTSCIATYTFQFKILGCDKLILPVLKHPVLLSLTGAKKRNLGNAYEVTVHKIDANLKTEYLAILLNININCIYGSGDESEIVARFNAQIENRSF